MNMKYSMDMRDTYSLIRIEGSMSDDFLREIRSAFEEAQSKDLPIIVDIRDVSFISSSGLGLLFNSNSRMKSKGRRLVVFGAREEIRRLFAVTRIENHIALGETLDEALGKI